MWGVRLAFLRGRDWYGFHNLVDQYEDAEQHIPSGQDHITNWDITDQELMILTLLAAAYIPEWLHVPGDVTCSVLFDFLILSASPPVGSLLWGLQASNGRMPHSLRGNGRQIRVLLTSGCQWREVQRTAPGFLQKMGYWPTWTFGNHHLIIATLTLQAIPQENYVDGEVGLQRMFVKFKSNCTDWRVGGPFCFMHHFVVSFRVYHPEFAKWTNALGQVQNPQGPHTGWTIFVVAQSQSVLFWDLWRRNRSCPACLLPTSSSTLPLPLWCHLASSVSFTINSVVWHVYIPVTALNPFRPVGCRAHLDRSSICHPVIFPPNTNKDTLVCMLISLVPNRPTINILGMVWPPNGALIRVHLTHSSVWHTYAID